MKKTILTLIATGLLLAGCGTSPSSQASSAVSSNPSVPSSIASSSQVISSSVVASSSKTECQHDWELTSTKEPTCKKAGTQTYTCKLCEKTKTEETAPALGHLISGDDYIHYLTCERPGCGAKVRKASENTFLETFYPKYEEQMKTDCLNAINTVIDMIKEYKDVTDPDELQAGADAIEPYFDKVGETFEALIDEYYVAETYAKIDKKTYEPLEKEVDAAYNEVYNQYMMTFYHAMHSPLKTYLLSPEDIAELEGYIDNFADTAVKQLKDDITDLEKKLDAAASDKRASLISQLISKRNELAGKYGYDNYYEYASARDFYREYTVENIEDYRTYTKQYLSTVLMDTYSECISDYTKLSAMGALYTDTACFGNYKALNTIAAFFDTLKSEEYGLDFTDELNTAFKEGRIFTPTSGEDGAFTQRRNQDGSFMYFAPDSYYSSCSTLAHEFGHFMYSIQDFNGCNSYDLKETHSQGDEALYQAFYMDTYMKNQYSETQLNMYDKFVVMNNLYSSIASTIVDEWEMALYTNYYDAEGFREGIDPSTYLTTLTKVITNSYNFPQSLSADNFLYYFTNASCYEISYGISYVPVMGLYCDIPDIGYEAACEKYYKLIAYGNCEEFEVEDTYLNVLSFAGFDSPFEESVYQKIAAYYA